MLAKSTSRRRRANAPDSDSPPGPAADGRQGSVSFGYRQVAEDDKAGLVRAVFDTVAPRYDLMNDLMSLGIHRRWKKAMIDTLKPRPDHALLDIGGGTGDISFLFLGRGGRRATALDVNASMIAVGRDRAIDRGILSGIDWTVGDAEDLPYPDGSFDACATAFCLRNVTRLPRALAEARRVLKPGGRFLCLEFSRVVLPVFDKLYDAYSFSVLPALGRAVAGDEDSYRYLAESIRRFPAQERFAQMIGDAGFDRVTWRNLSGGIAALHSAWRL